MGRPVTKRDRPTRPIAFWLKDQVIAGLSGTHRDGRERISSAVHSTTLPPLRVSRSAVEAGWISWGSGIHKRPSAPAARQVAPGPRRGEVKGAGGRFRLTDQGSVRMSSTLRAGHLVPRFPFAAARPPRIEAGTAKKPARRGLPAESRV